MLFVNQFFKGTILIMAYKIVFVVPIFYRMFIDKKTFKQSILENFSFQRFKKNIKVAFGFGIVLTLIYAIAYYVFRGFLNFNIISTELNNLASINTTNIIFLGIYIIVLNSVFEEYFWRGFVFNELRTLIKPWVAYTFTGIAFSLHHVMFYLGWFNIGLFVLVTVGLIGFAIIMNFFFEKYKDLLSCWLIHIFVDCVQIFIGLKIFGIL